MEIAQIADEFVEKVGEPKEGKWYRREFLDLCETHKLFGKKSLVNRLAIEMRNRGYYVDPITIHLAESETSIVLKCEQKITTLNPGKDPCFVIVYEVTLKGKPPVKEVKGGVFDGMELYLLAHSINIKILHLLVYEEDGKVYHYDSHKEIAQRISKSFKEPQVEVK